MKRKLLLILSLMLPVLLMANPVDKEEAKQKALSFLNGRSVAKARGQRVAANLRLVMSEESFHVFNVGSDEGFVIVSGDDCAPDVLGYADEGHFDTRDIPTNMKAWLQGYADQIKWMKEKGVKVETNRRANRTVKSSISPLIATRWDQGNPYNLKCPDFFTYGKSVTGCLATALAQILYNTYNRTGSPTATTQSIPGYTCSRNWSGNQISVSEVSATTFQWSKMQLLYSGSETDEQKNAVADLMLCCGASVNMDYANNVNGGSSGNLYKVPSALNTYFGFNDNVRYYDRQLYSTEEWENLVYGELSESRPVLYGGQSTGGGHAFVCDGYDSDRYYHINWGWSGMHDGYFLLSILNPYGSGTGGSSSSDGYSMGQEMLVGFQTGSSTQEEGRLTVNELELTSSSPIDKGNSLSISFNFKFTNDLTYTYDFYYGLALFNNNEEMISSGTFASPTNLGHAVYVSGEGTISLTTGELSKGNYKIKPVSKISGSSELLKCYGADEYYINVEVTESQISLTTVTPSVNLEASDITLTSDGVINTVQTVTALITNNSSSTYNGNVYLFVGNDRVSGNGIDVSSGGSKTAYFTFTPTTSGEKTIKITTDKSGSNQIGSGNITFVAPSSASLNLNEFAVANSSGSIIYGNSFKVSFSATNNGSETYSNGFVAKLYKQYNATQGSLVSQVSSSETLAGNETKTIAMSFDNLEYGESYFCWVYYFSESQESEGCGGYSYTISHGFITIDSDGNVTGAAPTSSVTVPSTAAVVDLRGQTTVTSVTPNENPNCLYLLDSEATVPYGLDSKNVVKGSTAELISLTDGYDFYTPIDFTAADISYTRTFTTAYDGTGAGWTTICLPFTVSTIKVGTEPITWFKSSSATDGRFWVADFNGDGVSSVNFGYTENLNANTPYLIAVPGNKWGDTWNLTNKAITFSGENAEISNSANAVKSGNNYKFCGVSKTTSLTSIYSLNASGNNFVLGNSELGAFRAYFTPTAIVGAVSSLGITFGETTGFTNIELKQDSTDIIYDLRGIKVGTVGQFNTLPKGIYIINGKKIIK